MPKFGFFITPPQHYCLLPNTDHRFTYPKQIIDCLSAFDVTGFRAALDRLCTPDVDFKHYYDGKQNPYGPNKVNWVGIPAVAELFTMILYSAPDIVFKIYDKVEARRDDATDECFISFKLLLHMTKTKIITLTDKAGLDLEYVGNVKPTSKNLKYHNKPLVATPTAADAETSHIESTGQIHIHPYVAPTETKHPHSPSAHPHAKSSQQGQNSSSSSSGDGNNKAKSSKTSSTSSPRASSIVNNTSAAVEKGPVAGSTFALESMAQPAVKLFNCGRIIFLLNSEHKITNINYIFRILNHE